MRACGPQLLNLVRTYGVPEGEAEDVAQDAFVAAWRALGDYDPARPFRAWLFHIGLNKARDWRRKRRVRSFFFGAAALDEPEALAVETGEPDPESAAHDRRRLARVRAAVARLPDETRDVFVLTTAGGLTYAEAGEALGLSVKAVEGRLLRARRQLQADLADIARE